MILNWLNLMVPLISFVVNVIFQIFIYRINPCFGLLKSEYIGFISGLANLTIFQLYCTIEYLQPFKDALPIAIANFLIYGSLSYCYFHFINLCLTARRIRLVRDIYESEGGLTLSEILEKYNAKNMIELRLERLLASRQIVIVNGKYYIHRPFILIGARIMVAMKQVFLGKRSEYDLDR